MLVVPNRLVEHINAHVEDAYPDEGAGFLLGVEGEVKDIVPLKNAREDEARHNRFLITREEYLKAELKADSLGLSLIGGFHSHPDCPNVPSEYDHDWAKPFFSYIIIRLAQDKAVNHPSWRLGDVSPKYE